MTTPPPPHLLLRRRHPSLKGGDEHARINASPTPLRLRRRHPSLKGGEQEFSPLPPSGKAGWRFGRRWGETPNSLVAAMPPPSHLLSRRRHPSLKGGEQEPCRINASPTPSPPAAEAAPPSREGNRNSSSFPSRGRWARRFGRGRMGGDTESLVGSMPPPPHLLLRRRHPSLREGTRTREDQCFPHPVSACGGATPPSMEGNKPGGR